MMSWLTKTLAGSSADVSARGLRAELDAGADLLLLDVRQPEEHAQSCIPGSLLVPLGELPHRAAELDPGRDVVVYCRSGGRSAMACRLLRRAGFTRVRNLEGGISAWLAAAS